MIRGSYRPALLPVDTPQGEVLALVFAANHAHPDHVGDLPLHDRGDDHCPRLGLPGHEPAVPRAAGRQLHSLGIDDDYVVKLLQQVQAAAAA